MTLELSYLPAPRTPPVYNNDSLQLLVAYIHVTGRVTKYLDTGQS